VVTLMYPVDRAGSRNSLPVLDCQQAEAAICRRHLRAPVLLVVAAVTLAAARQVL